MLWRFNLGKDETVGFPLLLLSGFVAERNGGVLRALSADGSLVGWTSVDGKHAKVLIPLHLGRNVFQMWDERGCQELSVVWKRPHRRAVVKLLFICFADAVTNAFSEAEVRIGIGALLMQTLVAEETLAFCSRRRTFHLDFPSESWLPTVVEFGSRLTCREATESEPVELFWKISEEIVQSALYSPDCKYLCWLGFPGSEEADWEHGFHLARGQVALVHGACLSTWPTSLEDALLPKSAFYQLSFGAAFHELAHLFDLPHSSTGLMSRNYGKALNGFTPGMSSSSFDAPSHIILSNHFWMKDDDVKAGHDECVYAKGRICCNSGLILCQVVAKDGMERLVHWDLRTFRPRTWTLPLEVLGLLQQTDYIFQVVTSQGRIQTVSTNC